tara:strand:+ start:163 stop:735 length:573 start_codon:yes stop_codon:yes gene_type:complete
MRKMLIMALSSTMLLITSCDSGGDGNSVDESALQGLWEQTEWCLEVNESCTYEGLNDMDIGCETSLDEYLFVSEGTFINCYGTSGYSCEDGTYTISGSTAELCLDDPQCESNVDSSSCDYPCYWDYNDQECIWEDGEDGEDCDSFTVSLSDDNQVITASVSISYEGCQFTQTRTYNKIGDSFEDYDELNP